MLFSKEELKKISKKGTTIGERLSSKFYCEEIPENHAVVDAIIEQWCQVMTLGDREKFEQRLIWDGLELNTVRNLISCASICEGQSLPPWTQTLNECLKAYLYQDKLDSGNFFLDPQYPLPFEEILSPFIYVARTKLKTQVGSGYELLCDAAHAILERSLLRWLVNLCTPSLEFELSVFHLSRQTTLVSRLQKSINVSSQHHYKHFTKYFLQGRLIKFFQEYPVLGRLVAQATDLWVDATGEFISRLASDLFDIERFFQPGKELGKVTCIKPDMSDRHHGGRSVMIISFASGLKLVYKPKDIGMEKAYMKLLAWLNQQDVPLPFKLLQVLERSGYGWVEFVEFVPCKDPEETNRYYQRCGMLLCLVYFLDSTDLHNENIVACGEHPVLIDLETLMHPWVREMETRQPTKGSKLLANQQLWHSVLRTALLPQWQFDPKGHAYDVSGLGGNGQNNKFNQSQQSNTIKTNIINNKEESRSNTNPKSKTTSVDEAILALKDNHKEIINGFQQMYRFLVKHRQALIASDSPLMALSGQPVRFIFRNTSTYASILQHTLHPNFLRDGAEWSIQLDILSRAMLFSDTKPSCWVLVKAEKQALEQMDIPLFTARSDSNALKISSNLIIEDYFTEPSFNAVITRLNKLNEQDLEQQISFIQGALYARTAEDAHRLSLSDNLSFISTSLLPLTKQELVTQARELATNLDKKAIHSDDGSVTWLAPQYLSHVQKFQLQPMGYNLYDGSCGLALFLAALAKISPGDSFRNLTLSSLQLLLKDIRESASTHNLNAGIGGALGSGGIIYALVHLSNFLKEPALLEDAKQVASLITSKLIDADKNFDIILGAAGAILGLLAFHNISTDTEVLEKAIACGNYLLNNRVASDSGYRAWATLDGKLLTGFSHGTSGIAYALLRLYKVTSETSFLEAAEEAIAYERSVFIREIGNWPDLRQPSTKESPACMCSWCHGAPGIGLARVAGLDILDTPEIRKDIEVAINTTKEHKISGVDHLCCGNLGRIEFLFTAGRKLNRPELIETAMGQAAQVVARAKQKGGFDYGSILTFHPGFFPGASGIGYELLRLAYPDQLPSVLLWE
ncbi:type 2 lanthipeptide synthetase LanM family protein [aff. Roholtiella sp. LEGE 12411]|uniref:type 2 lanthipeptide synthetase LanM family protein n=1 Tax=aff. Roholtiella sp. LEGE 12411 TaxID=1828822 RepID=UPI00187E0906|nr:type 2 lanthipeptide synthetase LanM family protein [aff. Roholtiella sp. LEGE 12411]MBE9036790.1 type 2 lantipeptide synthetase LanM family protein [aff. Roholtiella sp. LEGE 12411]